MSAARTALAPYWVLSPSPSVVLRPHCLPTTVGRMSQETFNHPMFRLANYCLLFIYARMNWGHVYKKRYFQFCILIRLPELNENYVNL